MRVRQGSRTHLSRVEFVVNFVQRAVLIEYSLARYFTLAKIN